MKRHGLYRLMGALAAFTLLPWSVPAQRAPQAKVKIDDLDLLTAAGSKTADQRLRGSVRAACPAEGPDLASQTQFKACRKDMMARGRTEIARATAASQSVRTADARHLSEVSIKRRVSRYKVTLLPADASLAARHRARRRRAAGRHIVHRRMKHRQIVRHKATD